MSTVPQWNADIITQDVEAEAEIQANGGLEKDSSGAIGVNVDGSTIVINQDGELEATLSDRDSAFVATYGTTTYQELSAAKAAGKAIFVTNVSGSLSAVMPMTSFSVNPAMAIFMLVIGDIEYQAKIDQDVWSSTSVSLQADWNESNQLSPAYIANKPTVDQVYDSTSTNAQSGIAVAGALSPVWLYLGMQPNMPSSVPSGYVRVRYTGSFSPTYADVSKYGGISYISDLGTFDFDQSKINTSGEADSIFKSGPFEIIGGVLVGNNGDTVKFAGATGLTSVSGLSLANDVTSITYLFQGCTSLESVNTFDTSNVTAMDSAFQGDTSLVSVNLFDTSSAVSMVSMFRGCTAVESGALALYQQASGQTTPPISYAYCFTDCGSNTTEGAAELAQIDAAWKGALDPYNPLGLPANTIRVQFTDTDSAYNPNDDTGWTSSATTTCTHVYGSVYDFVPASATDWSTALSYWSQQYNKYVYLPSSKHMRILGANSTGVTSLADFAKGHKYLESIALFDTSAVTDFSNFLYGGSGAVGPSTLPLFDTSSATTMASAFMGCVKVQSGALAIYQQASTQTTPPSTVTNCFKNCGHDTTNGAAELAQIPTSWGGTMA